MKDCKAYLDQELQDRGLSPRHFLGKKGDCFIWHAQPVHGGTPVEDEDRTRLSLVTRYWGRSDRGVGDAAREVGSGRYYLDKPNPPV